MMDQNFLSLLFSQVVQVTILAVAVWWVTRCFAKNRPHLAHALWLLVLLKCVTPPICHNPVSPFCWHWSTEEVHTQVVASDRPRLIEKLDSQSVLDPVVIRANRPIEENRAAMFGSAATELSTQSEVAVPDSSARFHPAFWLIGLWLVGVAVIAAAALLRSVLFLRWLRTFPRRKHDALSDQLDGLARNLGVKRKVRLEVVDGPVGPAVFGFWQPRIVLPQAIVEDQTPGQLEPLLAHELIHLRRGDLWWSAVQILATCVFWFHPLVWLASKKVSRESERSCDEETVASLGCCPTEYALCLLDVLEKKQRLRSAPVVPGIRQVDITSARLERVMTFGNGIRRTTPMWIRLAFVGFAIVVLPGAAATVQQETEEATSVEASAAKPIVGIPIPYGDRLFRNVDSIPQSTEAIDESVATKASGKASRMTREYDISEMLKHLESAELDISKSEFLKNWIGYAQPVYEQVVKEVNTFRVPNSDGTTESIQLPVCALKQIGAEIPELDFDPESQKVSIVTTQKVHERIAKDVEHFSQFGLHQVIFETRFLSAEGEVWESLGIAWETAVSVTGNGDVEKELDRQGKDAHVRSNRYVQKSAPALFSVIDDQKIREIVKITKGSNAATISEFPTEVTFNGLEASVTDQSWRPFVTSLRKVEVEGKPTVQPVISEIPDGTRLTLDPLLSDDGNSIEISSELVMSNILSVDTFAIPRPGDEPMNIQVPEVDVTSVTTDIELPDSKTLALSLPRELDDKKSVQLVVLVTARIVTPGVSPYVIDHKRPPVRYSEVATIDMDSLVPVATTTPPGKFKITTGDPQRMGEGYNQRLKDDLLTRFNYSFEIEGHVDYEIDDSKVIIRGNGMTVDSGDGMPSLGDKVKLVITKDDIQRYFRGNVQFYLDGSELKCQHLKYSEAGLMADGDVSWELFGTTIEADSVTIHSSEDSIRLVGSAKVVQKEQSRSYEGKMIVFDLCHQTVKIDDAPELHHVPFDMRNFVDKPANVLPASFPLRKVDPNVHSTLWNVNGLAHKVSFDGALEYYIEDDVQFLKETKGELKSESPASKSNQLNCGLLGALPPELSALFDSTFCLELMIGRRQSTAPVK